MNAELKKTGTFLLKLIIVVMAVDYTLGTALDFLHSRMKGGEGAKALEAIEESSADVYIFGSSRALYHYNPAVIGDSLNLSVYNAGRPAQTILYHLPVFKMILRRHTPKMVILDLNEGELVKEKRKYDLIYTLLPYYRKDESVKSAIDLVNPGYRYVSWSKSLPFNSSIFAIVLRNIFPGTRDPLGYTPMEGHRKGFNEGLELVDNCNMTPEFDPIIITALRNFVTLCREKNIKIVTVISPRFAKFACERKDLRELTTQLDKLHVDYLNFVDDPEYLGNDALMYDQAHLNYQGSIKFSRQIGLYLKRELRSNSDIVSAAH